MSRYGAAFLGVLGLAAPACAGDVQDLRDERFSDVRPLPALTAGARADLADIDADRLARNLPAG
ncbi:hypothetical protein [uncultured Methylobacterium sp.]|uniref:hypothetical protein n=1 Tax=uncultured Methylobacterium sp. TaxID=157278 RepID=UPI0035C97A81